MTVSQSDFSTETISLKKRLWRLSYPTMISFAMQSIYDLVDMAWVGQISKEAISGVTLFSTIYFLFTVLNEVAGSGSVSMLSQSYGRGETKRTQAIAEQTISFKVVLAIMSGILLFLFLKPLLNFYTQDPSVYRAALDYGYIRIFFLPMMFSSYSVNTVFRCVGDAKTPMKIMLISALLNLILDPLMIFDIVPGTSIRGLNLGVFGAALATVIATTISFLYGFFILLSGRRDIRVSLRGLFKLDRIINRQMLMIGLPTGAEMLVRQIFNAVMIKFVTVYGTTAIAIAGIGSKLMNLSFMPLFGVMMGGSAMIGHALGREQIDQAKRITGIAARFNLLCVSFMVLFALIFPEQIMHLFSNEAAVIEQGAIMIRLVSLSLLFLAHAFGYVIVFAGSGHTRPFLYSSVISRWLVQVPAAFLCTIVFRLPLAYFWLTYMLAEIGEWLIIMYHYRKGVWQNKRV